MSLWTTTVCRDSRPCFAAEYKSGHRYCMCLSEGYGEDGACPFCKPDKHVTNGTYYPNQEPRTFKKELTSGK